MEHIFYQHWRLTTVCICLQMFEPVLNNFVNFIKTCGVCLSYICRVFIAQYAGLQVHVSGPDEIEPKVK